MRVARPCITLFPIFDGLSVGCTVTSSDNNERVGWRQTPVVVRYSPDDFKPQALVEVDREVVARVHVQEHVHDLLPLFGSFDDELDHFGSKSVASVGSQHAQRHNVHPFSGALADPVGENV